MVNWLTVACSRPRYWHFCLYRINVICRCSFFYMFTIDFSSSVRFSFFCPFLVKSVRVHPRHRHKHVHNPILNAHNCPYWKSTLNMARCERCVECEYSHAKFVWLYCKRCAALLQRIFWKVIQLVLLPSRPESYLGKARAGAAARWLALELEVWPMDRAVGAVFVLMNCRRDAQRQPASRASERPSGFISSCLCEGGNRRDSADNLI